jgi:hypothetical protein
MTNKLLVERQSTVQQVQTVVESASSSSSSESESEGEHHCNDHRCVKCNPPPVAEEHMGPPVYDPYYRCWTFPYAKIERKPKEVIVRRPKANHRPRTKVITHEVQAQVDMGGPETNEINTQTGNDKSTYMEAEKDTQTDGKVSKLAQTRRPKAMDPNAATMIIIRFLFRLAMKRRMNIYRQ